MSQRSNGERERPVFSASHVLAVVGGDLASIKRADDLTYADLGAILGKSEDQAAKYCEGTATMDLITFARGWREWNGRFAGGLARLCHDSRPSLGSDRARESKVLKAALALSMALADDEEIDAVEVRDNRATLEEARDAIEELLGKLVRAA